MSRRKKYLFFIGIMILAGIGKVYYDTNIFKVETVTMKTEKLASNQSFTILQLTDIHNKEFGKENESLLKKVQDIDPDIVVITGDLISRQTDQLDNAFELVEKLVELNPNIYYVSGNHEWENPLREKLFEGLEKRNVRMIDNQNALVEIDNMLIQIAGVADVSTEHDRLDLAAEGLAEDYFTLLLSHAPDVMENDYPGEIDLILSGHTHGGQIRLPLIGAFIAPDQGFFPKYDKGLFTLKEGQQLYIDSGLGTSTVPVRLFNQSQMTLFTIEGIAD
ncbi:metallophosphoesterase [Gracilibacillus xinjiangensis]|uniref:Metallophosphoesterase n=1 Tax=Gracilibacillus xinjiangensis TaxID=1193282 RepID=A0ABV8WWB7_9BACI